MLLRNHGTLAVGGNVGECFVKLYFLERACQAQIMALSAGDQLNRPPQGAAELAAEQGGVGLKLAANLLAWPALKRKAYRLDPSCFAASARASFRRFRQSVVKPSWAWNVGIHGRPHSLGNLEPVLGANTGLEDYFGWIADNFDPSISWADLAWVREQWPGPIVIKGILDPDDARDAIKHGADGIVVSNHGGRQLDGAVSTARALPAIASAVAGKIPVWSTAASVPAWMSSGCWRWAPTSCCLAAHGPMRWRLAEKRAWRICSIWSILKCARPWPSPDA
jgi:hypothetical protein